MDNRNYLDNSNNAIIKRNNVYAKMSRHCKNCGHTVLLLNVDRIICSHCGYWVYKDDKTEFMYKMKDNMKKINN